MGSKQKRASISTHNRTQARVKIFKRVLLIDFYFHQKIYKMRKEITAKNLWEKLFCFFFFCSVFIWKNLLPPPAPNFSFSLFLLAI